MSKHTEAVTTTAKNSTTSAVISTEKAKTQRAVGFSTVKIAYIAMFVAINVAVGALSPRLGTLKITLTYAVCFLAGYFFGPIAGTLTGGIGDLLGCLIGGYAPNPIILCASCLVGLIPGLVSLIAMPKPKKLPPILHILVSYIITFVICTLFVNTYALYLIGLSKGQSFWVYMGIRAATQSPIVAINLALTILVTPLFDKVYKNTVIKSKV